MGPREALVQQARQGDRRAFDALVVCHRPRVLAYCTRLLRSGPDGEQAAQDVFVKAWVHLESFQFDSPFENWLMRIATHTCHNLCRTKRDHDAARGTTLDNPATLAAVEACVPPSTLEEEVTQRIYAQQLLLKIRQCAQTTKPSWDALDWHIFHLLYEDGVETSRDVARRLGKSEDTVKYRIYKHINRVLRIVRVELEAEDASLQQSARFSVS